MGSHYADMTSPELKPGNFGNIFLIGAHGGNILFWGADDYEGVF